MHRANALPSRPAGIAIAVAALVAFYVVWDLLPFGKPADAIQQMHFSPQQATVHRILIGPGRRPNRPIGSLARRSRRAYPPRSITLTSDGAAFRAYLLDMSGFDDTEQHVRSGLDATWAIKEGRESTGVPVAAKAVDVTEAHFGLGRRVHLPFFGDSPADRMLIVASDRQCEVTVRVSYR